MIPGAGKDNNPGDFLSPNIFKTEITIDPADLPSIRRNRSQTPLTYPSEHKFERAKIIK